MFKSLSILIFTFGTIAAFASNLPQEEPKVELQFADARHVKSININNDTVMGGLSSSHVTQSAQSVNFSGSVSLDNNGGFASVEFVLLTEPKQASRCQLIVKGDGKRYQLRVKTADLQYGEAYIAEFTSQKDQISEHVFHVDDFKIGFRGRTVHNGPALNLAKVERVGILIADKQQGHFDIALHSLSFQ
ncbi:CIA30 family protein [Shewanella sp. OMA3-2]|uniref:CIA30 family protein n=1 Tax=Shewanella sp. OMA3-2 TaxID=2908650 RepID=UPI001F26E649|nr:CIA30 family protein [Shewanella sp. OMA3-2]UJF22846.1 CIA30 family protein [Shewanella sp. OMA3-2]